MGKRLVKRYREHRIQVLRVNPLGATSYPSARNSGSQPSQDGKYQFALPSSRMLAGTSTERTIVASSSTATARPNPICWNITRSPLANPTNTATMISAAPVMSRPVDRIP